MVLRAIDTVMGDVERDMQVKQSGRNVVIHEIAHKLDMLNGSADGFPPLHHGMAVTEWSIALGAAYESLVQGFEHHHRVCINPYAATSPAEFFAVISEYFFCAPKILHTHFAMFISNFGFIIDKIRYGVFIRNKISNFECSSWVAS